MASSPARVLIVDDETSMRELLTIALAPEGHAVETAPSVAAAREALARRPFDLVVSDLAMPGESGLDLLAEIRSATPELPVILITAYASMEAAKKAFALGVYDCIDKGASFSGEEFRVRVRHALESRAARQENRLLRGQLRARHGLGTLVAASAGMRAVLALIERVAPTASTVLLTGESGTGKEVVARAIHWTSPRAEAPFVSINCGAMPAELLESELFGHVKGAFTGAVAAKKGLFEVARGGTLLLDEIGEMPPAAQVRLLRVLQERTIRLVGGTEEVAVDVRVLAATNADLAARVAAREFREDLYYRINVIPIHLPPLRERLEDLPLLAEAFARRFAAEMGKPYDGFAPAAMTALEAHDWPGNVRELENAVQRAVALSPGPLIPVEALPGEPGRGAVPDRTGVRGARSAATDGGQLLPPGSSLDDHLDATRRELMERALEAAGHVQTEAARRLGMTFRSFRYFAKQYGLNTRGRRRGDEERNGSTPDSDGAGE